MTPANRRQLVGFIGLVLVLSIIASCTLQSAYKIGFVGGLTGRQSDIGVAGRNGAILAVEELNKAGGIGGRELELVVKDDRNDPALVRSIDEDLIDSGVTTIIGHMTSVTAVASLPVVDGGKALIITPTATADALTRRDDMMITVMSPVGVMAQTQALTAVNRLNIKRMAIIYDSSNPEYTQNWVKAFSDSYQQLGGRVVRTLSFISGTNVAYENLANEAAGFRPEGVLIVAGAVDAAMFGQWLKRNGLSVPLFSSSWAMTADFIQHGGQAVEGSLFSSSFSPDDSSQTYRQFVRKYQERFGMPPNYAAAYSYEAVQILAAGIERAVSTQPQAVKKAILAQGRFPGLRGELTINATGDVSRICRTVTVKNGQFVTVQ